jgi:CelD/BcsL family acetyltransferase involved in cellulose biosynthesis
VDTPSELAEGFQVLRDLHQARWRAQGKAGVFASHAFSAFHEAVLPELLGRRQLQLVWLEVRGTPIAAVYNIGWGKRMSFYQGGRDPTLPQRICPGLVLHSLAMRQAVELGYEEYDFLAGASRYKRGLSHAQHWLGTSRLARPGWPERLRATIESAIEPVRRLRGQLSRLAEPG